MDLTLPEIEMLLQRDAPSSLFVQFVGGSRTLQRSPDAARVYDTAIWKERDSRPSGKACRCVRSGRFGIKWPEMNMMSVRSELESKQSLFTQIVVKDIKLCRWLVKPGWTKHVRLVYLPFSSETRPDRGWLREGERDRRFMRKILLVCKLF